MTTTGTDAGTNAGSAKPDLKAAADALTAGVGAVSRATEHAVGLGDDHQCFLYDLAHTASAMRICESLLDWGALGDAEARLACGFIADALGEFHARLFAREDQWGLEPGALDATRDFVAAYRNPAYVATMAGLDAPSHLDEDFELVAETFRRFGEDKIAPAAEHIHRGDTDIPEDIISGLAELGCFGLSVPEEYGGFASGSESDYLGMVIATEELSRASLGAGGSLITRPEILTRALERGGTEGQKKHWFPQIATGETMVAVAVTEPDYGSDVANLVVSASPTEGGWLISGTKTWCTFAGRADVLMLLARTDPDRRKAHRGLSLFIVPKPQAEGHSFQFTDERGGTIEGRAIATLGYRGMHSFEIAFDDWFVPAENLIGGDDGIGQGFYLQMAGFENGRLQTAARAVGVMQAAYDEARSYADERRVFGQPIAEYQLTQAKLGRMSAIIAAARQYSHEVARMMARGGGALEASMIKAYVCKAAEWVTREAQQIHGGFGFAEEYTVSRLFVDARVLSIFEGADETLCLKVIARRLQTQNA
ncbi:acyl-CoA dehydrogenase family protein [Candidatus Poriferisodalis sp.]|uniref:acyl-CoA dehydrogenase family protein n=1 Tax=Candidatus Poriferisodalis sp. TaxID=3101277 RepID=UPI003B5CC2D6